MSAPIETSLRAQRTKLVLEHLDFSSRHHLSEVDFEHLIGHEHPQFEVYRQVLADYHAQLIPPIPFLTLSTLFARPNLWVTKSEASAAIGAFDNSTMLATNMLRARQYLNKMATPLTICSIQGSRYSKHQAPYFRDRSDWFEGKYMIAPVDDPPQLIDCTTPEIPIHDPEILELYIRAISALTPEVKKSSTDKVNAELKHVVTPDERITLEFMIQRDLQVTSQEVFEYFDKEFNLYKSYDVVAEIMSHLRHKITHLCPTLMLADAQINGGVYAIQKTSS